VLVLVLKHIWSNYSSYQICFKSREKPAKVNRIEALRLKGTGNTLPARPNSEAIFLAYGGLWDFCSMEKVNGIVAARLIMEDKRVFIIISPDIHSLYNKYRCYFYRA
jgi:hypothetical protein